MSIFSVIEIVGTIAFAMSGALVAIEKELDYYGIMILAIITATGGGIIRDLLADRSVPASLADPSFAVISILSAIIVIFFYKRIVGFTKVLGYFDAVGLAAFTVIGADVALEMGLYEPYIVITFSMLTGTGGGVVRDVFAREIPFVFRKEVYAVATIFGAVAHMVAYSLWGLTAAVYACFTVTLFVRLFSMQKDIHLKVVKKG